MKATDDRFPATDKRPERFKVYVCSDLNCPEWWPASHGSGYCGNDDLHYETGYPPMRPLTLVAEKDCGHPDWGERA